MLSQQDLTEYFQASAETYRFLSQALLKELSEEAIEHIAAAEFPDDTGNANLDRGYALVKRYFSFSSAERRTQLACEYARVFLAAGVYIKERRTAIPYESVFTSDEHLMMQASRDDVVRFYREDGFQVDSALHEPEDHLSFELEYLSGMNSRALALATEKDADGLHRNVERQRAFIENHLLNWVPSLREVAQDYARLAFYLGLLFITEGALEQSKGMLDDIAAQIDSNARA